MGLMRKFMSVQTMGLVDYRNDSERSAAAERKKASNYAARTKAEVSLREQELALKAKELELLEREQNLRSQGL